MSHSFTRVQRLDDSSMMTLETAHLRVFVTPLRGADIYSIEDRRTGVDILFKTPWVDDRPIRVELPPWTPSEWLEYYRGGWQLLAPSGGSECTHHGVRHPYHGEACMRAWSVISAGVVNGSPQAAFTVELGNLGVEVRREVALARSEAALAVTDSLTNKSRHAVSVMVTEHIVFGMPLVSSACKLSASARTIATDEDSSFEHQPIQPGVEGSWPIVRAGDTEHDLGAVPGPGEPRQLLGYLSGFDDDAWIELANPDIDLSVRAEWNGREMPYLWMWQELNGTVGAPWNGRGRAIGMEPATSIPAAGIEGATRAGTARSLRPGGSIRASTQLTLRPLVTNVPSDVARERPV